MESFTGDFLVCNDGFRGFFFPKTKLGVPGMNVVRFKKKKKKIQFLAVSIHFWIYIYLYQLSWFSLSRLLNSEQIKASRWRNKDSEMKRQQCERVHRCVSSVLIGWLVCWGAAAVVLFCGVCDWTFFEKRHLVPPPPLFIFAPPSPADPAFAQRVSPTDEKTSRPLGVWHFDGIQTQVFFHSYRPPLWKTEE